MYHPTRAKRGASCGVQGTGRRNDVSLELIGAGFGRTGTLSLKKAIDELGFGPCYHMMEVGRNPGHDAAWHALAEGGPRDWEGLFEGYRATVDWPACHFWRELVDRYPDAKVLLSLRESGAWWESVHRTIYRSMTQPIPEGREGLARHLRMARKIVLEDTFDGRFEDRDHAIAVFEAHNQAVIDAIPGDRLLVYRPGDGWGPLCDFLGCDVPAEEYPHVNSTEEFQQVLEQMRKGLGR